MKKALVSILMLADLVDRDALSEVQDQHHTQWHRGVDATNILKSRMFHDLKCCVQKASDFLISVRSR